MSSSTEQTSLGWFDRQVHQFEQFRYGAMTILMTAQSCFGGIAAFLALRSEGYAAVAISAAATMAVNAFFLTISPARISLIVFYLSVIVNLGVILIYA